MESVLLYLTARYPVRSETFVRQDASLLREQGLHLLLCSLGPGDCTRQPDWPEATVLDSSAPTEPAGAAPGRRLARMLPPAVRQCIALLRRRRALDELCGFARDHSVQHIHAEFADIAAVVAAAAARRLGITYSVGAHARDVHTFRFDPLTVLAPARLITVCNRAARDRLVEWLPREGPELHLIHHGLILEQWPFHARNFVPSDPEAPFQVLFVGRFVEKKGFPFLLQAVALAAENGLPVRLTVVGAGPLAGAWRTVANRTGPDRVNWLGPLPRESVRECIRTTDCLAVPSIVARDGDREGVPNVVIEAMATGTPVVATETGGIPEVLERRTGWPIPPADPAALAQALAEIRCSPELAEKKAVEARRRIESDFDADKLARVRAAVFREVLQTS